MKNDYIEEWKDIKGYEGYYMISNLGNIYTIKRKYLKNKDLKILTTRNGYFYFAPSVHCKQKKIMINRAVYEAFVGPIPEGYDIHHINHNRQDNRLENICLLEKHRHRKMHNEENYKPLLQFTKEGQFVAEYPSVTEASRQTGISIYNISSVCNNRRKTAGGSIWKFAA